MSEIETLPTGEQETIYGTLAGAKSYLAFMVGDQYDAWRALTTDDQRKMRLVTAKRYLERFAWNQATAPDFPTRDLIAAFPQAEYELAAIACSDPSRLSTTETGSNVKAAGAGTARVEFFGRTSVALGTAAPLPDVAMQLVGKYLASSTPTDNTYGQEGNCESAFDDASEFEKNLPS
jgi:hypothetical protein